MEGKRLCARNQEQIYAREELQDFRKLSQCIPRLFKRQLQAWLMSKSCRVFAWCVAQQYFILEGQWAEVWRCQVINNSKFHTLHKVNSNMDRGNLPCNTHIWIQTQAITALRRMALIARKQKRAEEAGEGRALDYQRISSMRKIHILAILILRTQEEINIVISTTLVKWRIMMNTRTIEWSSKITTTTLIRQTGALMMKRRVELALLIK